MLLAGLLLFLAGWVLWRQTISAVPVAPTPQPALAQPQLRYQRYDLPRSIVHLLVIPAQGKFRVIPAVSSTVDTVANLAQKQGAIAAINGGFFDPTNQKTTATIIL